MVKSKQEKSEDLARRFAEADQSEWGRLTEGSDFRAAVCELQRRYGLPLPDAQKSFKWMGWTEPIDVDKDTMQIIFGPHGQRRKKMQQEVKELMQRFGIPEKWYTSVLRMVIRGYNTPDRLSLGPDFEIPPFPQPMRNNPRKNDWRPLLEWHKRHPDVSITQIAKMIHRNRVTVSRKLDEFDNMK